MDSISAAFLLDTLKPYTATSPYALLEPYYKNAATAQAIAASQQGVAVSQQKMADDTARSPYDLALLQTKLDAAPYDLRLLQGRATALDLENQQAGLVNPLAVQLYGGRVDAQGQQNQMGALGLTAAQRQATSPTILPDPNAGQGASTGTGMGTGAPMGQKAIAQSIANQINQTGPPDDPLPEADPAKPPPAAPPGTTDPANPPLIPGLSDANSYVPGSY